MDNGSTDGSPALDMDFPNATFMRLPRNFGATKALNIGVRTGVGEYVFFLSPEMEVAPDTVAKLAAALDADPDAVAVCPRGADIWRLPDIARLKRMWRDPDTLERVTPSSEADAVPVEYAGRSALMARKFFVRGINYIDERYGDFGGDLELAYQIRRSQKKTLLIPAAAVTRHPGPPYPPAAQTILAADRANGVATFLGKHAGFLAGLLFQAGAVLGSLVRLQLGLMAAIAGGSKIDGSQSGF